MKLSDIKLNPDNPRRISKQAMDRLVKNVDEFGRMLAIRPIVYDENGVILGGNMRYLALKKLGYKEIPDEWCRCVADMTEQEKKRFIILDNGETFGEWDFDALANAWDDLPLVDWGVGLPLDYDEIKETKDIPDIGEIEFAEELLLEHNYIILYFDNPLDWEVAIKKYGLKNVKSCDPAEKCQKIGIGRVIPGRRFI